MADEIRLEKRHMQSKWQVWGTTGGGSELLGEYDTEVAAIEAAVNRRLSTSGGYVTVNHGSQTFINVEQQ